MHSRRNALSGLFPKLTALSFLVLLTSTAYAADKINCDTAVHDTNQQLESNNNKPVNDEAGLVKLLRTLNKDDVLPVQYVTTEYAKKQGWSGNPQDSLWKVWVLNKKEIGGDSIQIPEQKSGEKWYSADLESVRGLRSAKRLIYSPQRQERYLTTNDNTSRIIIKACI
ncbi:ribonuclease domain-containing protein [Rahnella sikkimica]|uniref:Uncharacterized protein n=1 Tax=Rahnella sikkimica TaxID=1805933 RepID=A0A2L1UV24_9GAMM|nr:ribonuclease domain-containing protein [Rahnella sikkimica]AVF36714.1 hypothetical protein BV494_18090 [Rahnella sikkimica]